MTTEKAIPRDPPLGRGVSDSSTVKNSGVVQKTGVRLENSRTSPKTEQFDITPINFDSMDEWHFVLKSWKRTMRSVYEKEPSWVFYPRIHAAIDKIRRRDGKFVVARNSLKPDQLFGLAAAEHGVLHFVFVKKWLRRHGVASKLVEACGNPTLASAWIDTMAVSALARKFQIRRVDL